jgi:cyclohexa-1,5-dienecarbonyl-CoA hydratase
LIAFVALLTLVYPSNPLLSNPANRLFGQQTHCAPRNEAATAKALLRASIEFEEKSRILRRRTTVQRSSSVEVRTEPKRRLPAEFQFIKYHIEAGVTRMTLNRPEHNLLHEPMLRELADGIAFVAERDDVKLIVIDSAGKIFCGGIDVGEYTSERVFQMLDAFHSVFLGVLECSKPVLCIVNGPAIGGGAELAAFGDLVIATPKARFAQPEITIGVFPPLATTILPYLVGPKVALELVLLGEPVTAERALELGLVNRLVPEAQLEHTVNDLITRVTAHSGPVLTMAKKAILGGMGLSLRDGLKNSMGIFLNELYRLEDAQEGLRALVEKRKPNWKNR